MSEERRWGGSGIPNQGLSPSFSVHIEGNCAVFLRSHIPQHSTAHRQKETPHRVNDSKCVELSTTAMFMGTPISLAFASHACAAACAALRVSVGVNLTVAISNMFSVFKKQRGWLSDEFASVCLGS